MNDESGPAVDLFGEPPAPYRDPRGRRKLRFTEETYVKVEQLRALNTSQEDIAAAINVSVPTLRKYFFPELKQAVARVRGKILTRLMAKVEDGSVPAMRLALQLLEQGQALAAPTRRGKPAADDLEPLGKKAQADLDARTAHRGTDWGSLLPN